jgi:two-component system sensor histidine kinase KdpD
MQVFVILFENAMLALRETEHPTLQVTSTQTDEGLSIDIKDNGPGLPEGWEEKAFQPFVTSRKRDQHQMSTGLGLAIAKRIVERHNGRLWTTRPPDGGAQFSLWLPLRQPLLGLATEAKEGDPTI